ncbi:MAG: SpoIID/LytB domain-containing protein [Leptospirales bacterium]
MKRNYLLLIIIPLFLVNCASGPQFRPYEGYRYRPHNSDSSTFTDPRQTRNRAIGNGKSVRVEIYRGPPTTVNISGYQFTGIKGDVKKGSGKFTPASSGQLVSKTGQFQFNGKTYPGTLTVHNAGKVYVYVNNVPISEYLISVISHEMSPSWPVETLKAQAITARTYVMKKMERNAKLKYDIGSTTYDQVYGGFVSDPKNAKRAVEETKGMVITYEGKLAEVFYHSDCGGETAAASEVWNHDFPYLVRKRCEFKDSPEYSWEVTYSKSHIEKAFGISFITSIVISQRTPSKRVKLLVINSRRGKKSITASLFRAKLGSTKIRSTRFAIRQSGSNFVVRGRGYGHGVGLCQWCAKIMVEKQSMNHRSILRFFFPGTKIQLWRESVRKR